MKTIETTATVTRRRKLWLQLTIPTIVNFQRTK